MCSPVTRASSPCRRCESRNVWFRKRINSRRTPHGLESPCHRESEDSAMKYRTQDDIVWDGFPHPDPRSRHAGAEASIRIAPSFWSRLGQHVRDARGCVSARALWENWLTPEAASALAAGATDDVEVLGTRG